MKIVRAYNFNVVEDDSLNLDDGLAGFILCWVSDLDSRFVDLSVSGDYGRVVLKKSRR